MTPALEWAYNDKIVPIETVPNLDSVPSLKLVTNLFLNYAIKVVN